MVGCCVGKWAKMGLLISGNKTKIMRIGFLTAQDSIMVGQQPLEEVNQFTYLGSILASNRDADHNVVRRIAGSVFQRLQLIWSNPKINLATKIGMLNTIVIPTESYACEMWKKRLNVAQQRWLRQILRVSYRDHVTNEEVHCWTLWLSGVCALEVTFYANCPRSPSRRTHPTDDANQAATIQHGGGLSLMIYKPYTLPGMGQKQPQLIDYPDRDLQPNAPN